MTFDEYQKTAPKTALKPYDEALMNRTIWAMGIAGEAGEIVEKWKKIVHYYKGEFSEEQKQDFGKEIGDVLWYLTLFADDLGLSMEEIAQRNLEKLVDRQKRNVLKGSGDNR